MKTPVALLVFNRPDLTGRVLSAVRKAKPRHLLVVADGPRPSRPGEAERCAEVRALFDDLDWDCTVEKEFATENLGCKQRVSSGLDWVFRRAECAIMLEDDCVPHASFFPYCEELLERYRDHPEVMGITGDNFQGGIQRGAGSYYFSRLMHVWGWASWRRAWSHYDLRMARWPELRSSSWLLDLLGDRATARAWGSIFDRVHAGEIDTWDYQWVFAIWVRHGLVVTPNVNLVSNIGAGAEATHTKDAGPWFGMPVEAMDFPLTHPEAREVNREADRLVQRAQLRGSRLKWFRDVASRILGRRA